MFSGVGEKELFCEASPISLGNHVKEGILATCGKHSSSLDFSNPQITDVFPTIMEIFGLNPLSYVDGKSLMLKVLKAR